VNRAIHAVRNAALLFFVLSGGSSTWGDARPHESSVHPARWQLIGAWRLVAIEYAGPSGETVDPFYQAGSTGIIIYDRSGWMSVQIAAPNRRAWEVPAVRVPRAAAGEEQLKAEAFDTYYSYFGTWTYDAATAVVAHHVAASNIPAETGSSYSQTASFEEKRLVLTTHSGPPGRVITRRKVWEKLTPGAP